MDAEGEVYVVRNREDDMPHQPDFSDAEVITEEDSLGAIYQYYSTMEGESLHYRHSQYCAVSALIFHELC